MRILRLLHTLGLAGALLASAACSSDRGDESGPPFGGPADLARAETLWSRTLAGYRSWPSFPGLEGWQEGMSPHGAWLQLFVSPEVAADPGDPPPGSILVKENYPTRDSSSLAAVTVMQRIPGYDPENHDWFWVKYAPDGSVMLNEAGMPLAGRVARGMSKGCIACHGNAEGGDLVFLNDD